MVELRGSSLIELSAYPLGMNWLVTKHKMFRYILYNVKLALKQFSLTIYPLLSLFKKKNPQE